MSDDFLDNEDWPIIDEEEMIQYIFDSIKKNTGLQLEKELIKMVMDYELDYLDEHGLTEEAVFDIVADILNDESEDEEDGMECRE